jgi:hypothetical protein
MSASNFSPSFNPASGNIQHLFRIFLNCMQLINHVMHFG